MTREEAIYILKNTAWLGSAELAGDVTEAVKMAVNVLKRSEAPNSSDTISRQAVLQRLTDIAYNSCKTEGQAQVIDWAKTLVCVMPSAQPERKNGQWKVQTIKGKNIVYCSECGFGVHEGERRRYRYCPNCGAEMRGEEDG